MPYPPEAARLAEALGCPVLLYYKSSVPLEEIGAIPVELLVLVHINDCEGRPRAKGSLEAPLERMGRYDG